jgi:fucose permease
VSFLFQQLAYEKAVSVLGVILLVPVLFTLPAKYPAAPEGFTLGQAFGLLREPLTIVAALVLFCYIALESSFTNWLAPFGKEVIKNDRPDLPVEQVDASAARMLSAFAVAMMIGRLITGLTTITNAGGWLIAASGIVAAVVILAMTGVKGSSAAFTLAALSGLVFAPAFPTTVGVTFAKAGGGSGSLFGIIFAVGLLGAVIVPKAIGNMAKGTSVQKALKLLLPICIILAILAAVLQKLPSKAAAAEPAAPQATAPAAQSTEAPAAPAQQP